VLTIRNDGDALLTWQLGLRHASAAPQSVSLRFVSEIRRDKSTTIDPLATPLPSAVYSEPRTREFLVAPGDTSAARLPLGDVLNALDSGFSTVTRLIPEMHEFRDGDYGDNISDGGDDMYDGGNFLWTDLGGSIEYSDGMLQTDASLGPGGEYFTRKHPGLFVFATDFVGVGAFRVAGDLGADGGGSVDGAVFRARSGGIDYIAFTKRVWSTDDPSVNHLIIVEDNGQATHEFATNTNDDYHRVYNLAGSKRLYYLLYASLDGGYIDNERTIDILESFLALLSPSWLDADPVEGSVAAGASTDVEVTLNAAALYEGEYRGEIVVHSDDPLSGSVTVPITLSVDGDPEISAVPAALDFGDILLTLSDTLSLEVVNTGTDSLRVTEVEVVGSAFGVDSTLPFVIGPAESETLRVSFAPTVVGAASGSLELTSNDPAEPTFSVPLSGVGVPPPVISVDPESVSLVLDAGTAGIDALTLTNSGGSPLSWTASARSGRIALLGENQGALENVAAYLSASKRFLEVTPLLVSGGVPSRAEMAQFDAIGVMEVWTSDTDTLGDRLADYVDSGGGLLLSQVDEEDIGGRFTRENYWLLHLDRSWCAPDSLGVVHDPSHPILGGVDRFSAGLTQCNASVASASGDLIASFTNGGPLLAVDDSTRVGRRVDTGFMLMSGDYTSSGIDPETDAVRLVENAFAWLAHGFLAVSPSEGVLEASASAQTEVAVDGSALINGQYSGLVRFESNDPASPLVDVPFTVTVVGSPRITAIPADIDFGTIVQGWTRDTTLVVRNAGSAPLEVSDVTVSGDAFSIQDVSAFTLVPRQSESIEVRFAPGAAGPWSGSITFSSDDPAEPSYLVPLTGVATPPPDIALSDQAINEVAEAGSFATTSITISNSGDGDLNWTAQILSAGAPSMNESVRALFSSGGRDETASGGLGAATAFAAPSGARIALIATYGSSCTNQSCWDYVLDVEAYLNASGRFGSVKTYLDTEFDLTLEVLREAYDAVGVFGRANPSNYEALGDLLADFVDMGGGLVTGATGNSGLGGRFESDEYWLFRPGVLASLGGTGYLGEVWQPYHPIIRDQVNFTARSTYLADKDVAEAASLLASFGSGAPAIAVVQRPSGGRQVEFGCRLTRYPEERYGVYHTEPIVRAFDWVARDFGSIDISSGTISPGASDEVVVTLDAGDLTEDTYFAGLNVHSDDPDEAHLSIPITFSVTGDPNAVFVPDTLRFDTLLVGLADSLEVVVGNDGPGWLEITDATSNDPAFVFQTSLPLTVAPFEAFRALVLFVPDRPGPLTGEITLQTNDPGEPNPVVQVHGVSLPSPEIGVSPPQITAVVESGAVTSEVLTVANTGTGELQWHAHFDSLGNIAVLAADGGKTRANDVARYLRRSGRFSSVTVIDGRLRIPTVEDLQVFDAVGVLAMTSWYGAASGAIALGNVLADYVDAGGNLLISPSANVAGHPGVVAGRFDTEGYWLISPVAATTGTFSLESIVVPDHPIMAGVDEFSTEWKLGSNASVASEAQVLARYDDGSPLIAALITPSGGHRVDVPFSIATKLSWTSGMDDATDETRLVENIFQWMLYDYAEISPMSGIVPGESSAEAQVRFDATRLETGTYSANIAVNSNDPRVGTIRVPVTLTVSGEPNIVLSSSDLLFGDVFVGGIVRRPLTVGNAGGLPLEISSVEVTGGEFEVDAEGPSTVSPFDSLEMTVTFEPQAEGPASGQVVVNSNDPDSPTSVVTLSGIGLPAPVLEADPTEVAVALNIGNSSVRLLTLGNAGGSTLDWSIALGTPPADAVLDKSPVFVAADGSAAEATVPVGGSVHHPEPSYRSVPLVFSVDAFDRGGTLNDRRPPQHGGTGSAAAWPSASQTGVDFTPAYATPMTSAPAEPGSFPSLEIVRDSLASNAAAIEAMIPEIAGFDGGVEGTSIIHTGYRALYGEGNILGTDLADRIPYSDGTIVDHDAFGAAGKYFTFKNSGLFVLAADLDGVTAFDITGSLQPGLSNVDGIVLQTVFEGVRYGAFVKRVFRTDGSNFRSINHMIIVSEPGGAVHSFTTSTSRDDHEVSGLGSSARLYALVYAGHSGRYIDDVESTLILNAFLGSIGSSWLAFSPTSGSLPPDGRTVVDVRIDAAHLDGGTRSGTATLVTNDPVRSSVPISTTVSVTGSKPVPLPDSVSTDEDVAVRLNVVANDSDPDGDAVSVVGVSNAAHGDVAILAGDTLLYTPDPDFFGVDLFTYEISDGTASASAMAQIAVLPVNDPPTITSEPVVQVQEERRYAYRVIAKDPEGSPLHYTLVVAPSWLTIGGTTGLIEGTPPRAARDTVVTVLVQDEAGAETTQSYAIDVINVDYEPPILVGVSADPSTVDLTGGPQSATLAAHVTDAPAGVVSVDLSVAVGDQPPIGGRAILVDGTALDGRWETDVIIPWNAPSGDWPLQVHAADEEGNDFESLDAAFLAVSGGDIEGPAVAAAATVNPEIADITDGPREVVISVPLRDGHSGISSVVIELFSASGESVAARTGSRISGTDTDGVWQAAFQVELAQGTYDVSTTSLDAAGNETTEMAEAQLQVLLPLPEAATGPSPFDGELQVPRRPGLAWSPARGARRYLVFVWPAGSERPEQPVEITAQTTSHSGRRDLAFGADYSWQIVSVNPTGETDGEVWTFTIMQASDLIAVAVESPSSALAGQSIEIVYTVENRGHAGTRAPSWSDQFFLSADEEIDLIVDTPVFSVRNLTALGQGEAYTNRVTIPLPERLFGSQYLIVSADYGHNELEEDEDNNDLAQAIQIDLPVSPDLQVSKLITPGVLFSSTWQPLTWMIQNVGPGRTRVERWREAVYLSEDDELDPEADTRLSLFWSGRQLLPGDSILVEHSVRLPDGISGEYHVFVRSDALNHVFEPLGESNNVVGRPVTVSLSPPPDLTPVYAATTGELLSGQTASVIWTVANEGPGTATGLWQDQVLVSRSETFDPDAVHVLGSFDALSELDPDSSYTNTKSIELPYNLVGPVYLFVRTDWRDDVYEYILEDNNVGSGQPAQIQASRWPDLQVVGARPPETAEAGRTLLMSWTVTNAGTSDAPSTGWVDTVYVSPSNTWDRPSARVVGYAHGFGLAASRDLVQVASGTIPDDLEGEYFLYIRTDANQRVFEHTDEDNNLLNVGAVRIIPMLRPDLSVTAIDFDPSGVAGSPHLVQWTVANTGTGIARTVRWRWTDRVYLSRDASLSRDADLLLGETVRPEPLAAGSSYQASVDGPLPSDLFGDYFLFVVTDALRATDDANGENNKAAGADALSVIALSAPNLEVAGLSAPDSAVAGRQVDVAWTVRNSGIGEAHAPWKDRVYLSSDARPGIGDISLPAVSGPDRLVPGESYARQLQTGLRPWMSGTYYLIYSLDYTDDLFESSQRDNVGVRPIVVTVPPPADLVVHDVTGPQTATPGEIVTVSWSLQNEGVNPAVGTSHQAVYVSRDSTWDVGDPLIGVHEEEISLAAGALTKHEISLSLESSSFEAAATEVSGTTPGLEPGSYRFIVRADVRNAIRETDDRNNDGVARAATSVDIQMLSFDAPTSDTWRGSESRYFGLDAREGVDVRVSLGSALFHANELYVAHDRIATASDFDFAHTDAESPLKQVIVPSAQAGRYYVLARSEMGAAGDDDFTLLAEELAFSVRAIAPATGGHLGPVTTTIDGAGFRPSSHVFLRSASVEREAFHTEFVNTTQLRARFDLNGLSLDRYDVVVRNESGEEAVQELGFAVVPSTDLRIELVSAVPGDMAIGRDYPFRFRFENVSNNDIPYAIIRMEMRKSTRLTVKTHGRVRSVSELFPDSLYASGSRPLDYVVSGNTMTVPFIVRDLAPGEPAEVTLFLAAAQERPFEFPLVGHIFAMSSGAFMQTLYERMEAGRQLMLSNPELFPEGSTIIAQDPEAFRAALLHLYEVWDLIASGNRAPGSHSPAFAPVIPEPPLPLAVPGITTAPTSGTCKTANVFCGPGETDCSCLFRYAGCAVGGVGCLTAISAGVGGSIASGGILLPAAIIAASYSCGMFVWGCSGGVGQPPVLGCLSYVDFFLCATKFGVCEGLWGASDPNDMLGPAGFGDERWVSSRERLPYTIRFENDPEVATAPAQEVFVTHQLDSTLDARSFRLGPFGFAGLTFDVEPNSASLSRRLDVTDSLGVVVDLAAGIDLSTQTAFWTFRSIDPATGLLPYSPFDGFLPINDSLGHGEGFVSFSVRPNRASRTGDRIEAQATIIFDTNDPIDTPAIFNTIDSEAPSSRVTFADPIAPGEWDVSLVAEDDEGGSGVRDYTLYASPDGEIFTPYQSGVVDPKALYVGDTDVLHSLFSIATDNVGNAEAIKSAGEVTVDVEKEDVPLTFALHPGYPNPFNPVAMLPFDIARTASVEIRVYDVLGRLVRKAALGELPPGRYQQQLNLAGSASGVYVYEVRVTEQSRLVFRKARKIILIK
jgi:hypothetical protein